MKKLFATTKSRVITGVVALLALLVAAAAAFFVHFSSHALPGTTVAGHPVGGQTPAQVAQLVESLAASQTVELAGPDGATEAVDLPTAGVYVKVDETVDEVFGRDADVFQRLAGVFEPKSVEPVVAVNGAILKTYAKTAGSEVEADPVDATVHFDPEQGAFNVVDAVVGTKVDTASLAASLAGVAQTLSDGTVTIELVPEEPVVTTEAAAAAAEVAAGWLAVDIQTTDADGEVQAADPTVIASWVTFQSDDGQIKPDVSLDAVSAWVNEVAASTNREVVNGQRVVNSAGDVLRVQAEGVAGRTVTNQDAVASEIVTALAAGTPYVGAFAYDTTEPLFEDRVVADGAENLAYMAAAGERWIDVNLSTNYATAYEGATPVMRIPMAKGAPQTPTVTGEYKIWAKVPVQDMSGVNADGSKWKVKDVPSVLYFYQGYALHGSWWRSVFGVDPGAGGSHGCLNLPVDQAKALYDWASVGDVVVSHH